MKKFVALALILSMMFIFCSCGTSQKAFDASKAAYDNVITAYEITEEYSSDIYEAWMIGIYDGDELTNLDNSGSAYLAQDMNLSEAELIEGIVHAVITITGEEWDNVDEEQKDYCRDNIGELFTIFEDDLFSFCVTAVNSAYELNGKVAEAQTALDAAKTQMKDLSQNYSDYEHYPNLKGFYTTTSSFFDFCQNPTGSFEQVKTTINDYKNEARDYLSDLDYIFEE